MENAGRDCSECQSVENDENIEGNAQQSVETADIEVTRKKKTTKKKKKNQNKTTLWFMLRTEIS